MNQNERRSAGNGPASNTTGRVAETESSLSVPRIEPDDDNLTAALKYAEAGWYLLPVKRGSKKPGSIVGDHWQSKSSRDRKVIAAWFAGTDHGIALHCGRSGAVVFDVDAPAKLPDVLRKHLETAPYQATRDNDPDRGHYVFLQPAGRLIGNSVGRLGNGWGEVRGANGVIIVAPSEHEKADAGARYEWGRTGPVPESPAELAEQLTNASPAEDAATDEQVQTFIAEHTAASRPGILAGLVTTLKKNFAAGESRHQSTVSVLAGAMKEARAGFYSAAEAIGTLKPMFVTAAMTPPISDKQGAERDNDEAEDEFAGILAWAVGQALAADLDEIRRRVEEKMPAGDDDDDEVLNRAIPHAGHLGMAIKLARRYHGKLLYVHPIGWHRFDGKRFERDTTGAARRAVHSIIKSERAKADKLPTEEREKRAKEIARYETASAITGILTEAAVLREFAVSVHDIDADPWLFNCANGTLDLRTMELRKHDPADKITKVARGAYDPAMTGIEWTRFIERVLPDDDVRHYWQRIVGLSLLGKVNGDKQLAPIMTGSGANGKTTATEAVSFAMGDYAATAEPALLMSKRGDTHPTGIADLLGKRLVITSETEQDRRFDIPLLKRLTGGDTIKARYMRQDFFEFQPSHLLLLSTNHLPRVDDDTEAVWRRIRVIPFAVQIPEDQRDDQLGERLQAEADAVLTWIVAGWIAYRDHGLKPAPTAVLEATGQYKSESDAVGRFIGDECSTAPAVSATTSALYDRWQSWAARERTPELSRVAFGRALDSKGYPADQKAHGRPRRGICLRPQGEP
jgi:putative DNA primase/helicase